MQLRSAVPSQLSDYVTISNCWFDRAGRNIVSIVNSQDWTFEDCYFGSAWGLYHVDMESTLNTHHNEDGHFLRCVFDGVTRGTVPGTYAGANWLIFVGDTAVHSRPTALRLRNVNSVRFIFAFATSTATVNS